MTIDLGLRDRVVVLTGSGGIGVAAAAEMASQGAAIAFIDHDPDALAAAVAHIEQQGGRALGLTADVRDEDAIEIALERIETEIGPIYGLVPSAGITRPSPAQEMPTQRWHDVIDVNLTGTFLVARLAARRMLPRGRGAMVFLSSIDGLGGHDGRANYCASKWGVIGMAKAMALDWGRFGVRVNTVCPGPVDSPMFRAVFDQDEIDRMFIPRIALGRLPTLQEQARAVTFLVSDYAAGITGAVLAVDGGMSAGYLTDLGNAPVANPEGL